jgi:hypothetical protein
VAAQRFHCAGDGVFGHPAHLRDESAELADIGVEGLNRMIVQWHVPFNRSGR